MEVVSNGTDYWVECVLGRRLFRNLNFPGVGEELLKEEKAGFKALDSVF